MPAAQLTIYLIAGCNGAGKTTFAKEFLPKEVKCLRFLNADEIARGLSPFNPNASAVKAGRLLLQEIHDDIRRRHTFALETTLSGQTYLRLLRQAKRRGYVLKLYYLWLPDPTVAIARVRERVRKGGHDVPVSDIRRRFHRSLANLARHYLSLADSWSIFDNSGTTPRLVAETYDAKLRVVDTAIFGRIVPDKKTP
jgi:predicted ABC-type ATPase